jgi:hypothetical protein
MQKSELSKSAGCDLLLFLLSSSAGFSRIATRQEKQCEKNG